MDGTLIVGDTLWHSLFWLLRHCPLKLLLVPLWLCRGKAGFKAQVAAHVIPDAALLIYREAIVEYLTVQRAHGVRIILATAANRRIAQAVAAHLGLFEKVLASDENRNLSGGEKVRAIREYIGDGPYGYIGNSWSDVPIWLDAAEAILVCPSPALSRSVSARARAVTIFGNSPGLMQSLWKVLRPRHWAKNILLIVPLITAHKINDANRVLEVFWSIVSFSFAASGAYIINDLLDCEFDRRHVHKQFRPIANGSLDAGIALVAATILFMASIALPWVFLPIGFMQSVLLYIAAAMLYSVCLKVLATIDVIVLAGLYTLRVIAGGLAIGVTVSPWLLAFSMFLFLSLAFVKRYSGLDQNLIAEPYFDSGRAYRTEDKQLLGFSGVASGYMAVGVFALYINNSPDVPFLYRHPQFLWLVCPLLLYWIQRIWMLTFRGEGVDDPFLFALKDTVSYSVGLAVAMILWLAL
jgi:4-hydroxybenzoate polyprenyltransferase